MQERQRGKRTNRKEVLDEKCTLNLLREALQKLLVEAAQ